MRKRKALVYFSLFVLTGSVGAAQVSVDEDFMQIMDDRQKSLTSNIALGNAQAASTDIRQIAEMFNDVEAFYAQKGNAQDAVTWSRESKVLAATITKSVAAKNFDAASQTSVSLAQTCKECHRAYKKEES